MLYFGQRDDGFSNLRICFISWQWSEFALAFTPRQVIVVGVVALGESPMTSLLVGRGSGRGGGGWGLS